MVTFELAAALSLLLGAQFLAMVTPGPNMALLLAVAPEGARSLGPVVVGFAVAGLVFSVVSVAALHGAWSQGFALGRLVAQLLGALWLAHVGIGLVRASRRPAELARHAVPAGRGALFLTGFATNASNPKTLAFFSSILAIYLARVGTAPSATGLAIGAIFANSLLVHWGLGRALGTGPVRRGYARWGQRVRRVTGIAFVGFGLAFGVAALAGLRTALLPAAG